MAKKLIILGTGGNAVDILDTINDINAASATMIWECAGFLDDKPEHWGKTIYGVKVLGPLALASAQPANHFFVNGIGSVNNFSKKKAILSKANIPDERFATIIHPTASVSRTAQLGRGTVLLQHVTITFSVKIGDHVMILPNTVVSHDDVIGAYCSIAGGVCIAGQVTIGQSCYLGQNSSIISDIRIGDYCLIGMGSTVRHSVEANTVVVGNPARILRKTLPDSDSNCRP